MKTLLTTLLITLLLATSSHAAKLLRFGWDYTVEDQAHLAGFRLYQDGLPIQDVDPSARSVDTPYLEDKDSHIYHLTAFTTEEESGPSDMVRVPPYHRSPKRIATGTFSVEIIEVE
jgi:hypothetical protein